MSDRANRQLRLRPHSPLLALACLALLSFEAAADRLKEAEGRLRSFFEIQRAADQFVKELDLSGRSVQDAMTALSGRGFTCDIKRVTFGKMQKSGKAVNVVEQYVYEEESRPLILCAKGPGDVQDCVLMDLSMSAKWQDPQRPLEQLLREASSTLIDLVGATCKVR